MTEDTAEMIVRALASADEPAFRAEDGATVCALCCDLLPPDPADRQLIDHDLQCPWSRARRYALGEPIRWSGDGPRGG